MANLDRPHPGELLSLAFELINARGGDYDNANIEVRSADEVGQLARTFNVMIDVLRQRERERSGRGASIGFDKDE